ncbi:GFA family protein [Defluviimonas sp. WL0002]|uniref:GFA family protein n=1 Tax=Albidovulum marisflavi TaxID=2984159 RepID=A0ABT2Z807_9RHOB|nr:GFA family protein [Defluviimonas sp. WL0002]
MSFDLPSAAGDITACHCVQCRKLSGHYAASFDVDEATIAWRCRDTIAEYETPAGGRRGFCNRCGSSLWFRSADGAFSVEAGSVIGPTGGRLAGHIFVGSKGDYYTIEDGLPQSTSW